MYWRAPPLGGRGSRNGGAVACCRVRTQRASPRSRLNAEGHDRTGLRACSEERGRVESMIGLVLVTHGRLAAEFVTAMEHVVGPQEAIEAICIGPDDDMEGRRKDIADAIAKVDQGQGVIILTDLFGGTPSNLAISLMKGENVEVIAGVNLPMLIRLEGARKVMPVHAAVAAAREAGRKYISVASEILGEAAA